MNERFKKSSEMQRLYSCYSPAKHTLFLRVFLVVFLLLLTMAISFRLWVTYPIPSRKKPVLRGDYFWDNWRVKRYLRSWGIKGTDWLEQGICPVKCINCDEVKKTCSLDLRREEITHLKWAGGLQITSLNISGKHVSDIGPLASQPIATLDISGTFVSDLGPISSLTNLCSLNFDNTLVSDLGPLAKWAENTGQPHPVLRMLSLRNTRVADLTPLKDIDIERLHLDGIPCDDLSSIRTNLLSVISFSLDPDKEWKGVDHLRACTNIVFLNNLRPSSYSWRLFDFFYSDEVDRSRFSSAPSSWDLSKLYEAKRAVCHDEETLEAR